MMTNEEYKEGVKAMDEEAKQVYNNINIALMELDITDKKINQIIKIFDTCEILLEIQNFIVENWASFYNMFPDQHDFLENVVNHNFGEMLIYSIHKIINDIYFRHSNIKEKIEVYKIPK